MLKQKQRGFTIVELLIVIVVIAILAAISVVAYTGVQNRANNSTVQSDLKNIATKIEMYHAEQGSYPSTSALTTLGLGATKSAYDTTSGIHQGSPPVHNLLYCKTPESTRFALVGRSKSGDTFQYAGGSIGPYQGTLYGNSQSLCLGAGINIEEGAPVGTILDNRAWFFTHNAWQPWVNN